MVLIPECLNLLLEYLPSAILTNKASSRIALGLEKVTHFFPCPLLKGLSHTPAGRTYLRVNHRGKTDAKGPVRASAAFWKFLLAFQFLAAAQPEGLGT